jgi:GntR family transcriptional regulator
MVEIKAPVSRWKQVAEYLREQILNGTFAAGQPLPSEQQLADEFGLSRPTIRNAINDLKAAGLVEVQRPRGTFVRSPLSRPGHVERRGLVRTSEGRYEDLEGARWRDMQAPVHMRVNAMASHTELLHVPPGEPMLVRTVVQTSGDVLRTHRLSVPFSVATDTPWADDPQLPAPGQVYAHFDAHGRLHWEEYVRARMPLPDEADALRATAGTPVLHITRIAKLDKKSVAMEEIVVRGDALEAAYSLPIAKARGR